MNRCLVERAGWLRFLRLRLLFPFLPPSVFRVLGRVVLSPGGVQRRSHMQGLLHSVSWLIEAARPPPCRRCRRTGKCRLLWWIIHHAIQKRAGPTRVVWKPLPVQLPATHYTCNSLPAIHYPLAVAPEGIEQNPDRAAVMQDCCNHGAEQTQCGACKNGGIQSDRQFVVG